MMADMVGVWRPVAAERDVPPGEMFASEIGGVSLAVYNVDGAFFATDNICTHAYALLSDGWLDGDIIECPLHGGQFNVRTGQALGDPVTCDLRRFPTRLRDGRIEVQVPEAP
jgi:nitrite reductase/ring-hydroxylating ferredoxin subunit